MAVPAQHDTRPPIELSLLAANETPVGRLIAKLAAVYPAQVTGKELAAVVYEEGDGNWFASLCFHFIRANEALAPYGWQACRSGGEPHSAYFLRPVRPSQLARKG